MNTSSPNTHLELGYRIRRANLEACGGLTIFPHDLKTFCIPKEQANYLADAYKRYLCASGILEWQFDTENHRQLHECDRQSLVFFHERTGTSFVKGEFALEAAIEFVWMEARVPKHLAIRWCMMMEYVSYEDQRTDELRNRKADNATDDAEDANHHPEPSGGGHDG